MEGWQSETPMQVTNADQIQTPSSSAYYSRKRCTIAENCRLSFFLDDFQPKGCEESFRLPLFSGVKRLIQINLFI